MTLLSVLFGLSLTIFSIARSYLAVWLAVLVTVSATGGVVAIIKLSGRDGWLQKLGRWLTSSG